MDFNIRVAVGETLLQSNECLCLFEMGSKSLRNGETIFLWFSKIFLIFKKQSSASGLMSRLEWMDGCRKNFTSWDSSRVLFYSIALEGPHSLRQFCPLKKRGSKSQRLIHHNFCSLASWEVVTIYTSCLYRFSENDWIFYFAVFTLEK